jgi:hypothetical protein
MKRQIEQKGVIPDSQAGFRKGKGTMDNIHPGSFNKERIKRERGEDICRLQGGV